MRPGFFQGQHLDVEQLGKAGGRGRRQHGHAQPRGDQLADRVEAAHLQPGVERAPALEGRLQHQLVCRGAHVQADDVEVEQGVERHRVSAREDVVGGHDGGQGAAAVVARGQAGVGAGPDEDADVGSPFGHRLHHVGARHVFQAHADARVRAREGGEIGRQAFGDGAGVGDHAQVALDAARELHHLALERMQRGVERADVAHQRAAGLGEVDAARAAIEQAHAQAGLEVGQALAGRRQRQVLALGASRDAAGLGDGEDEVERDEIEAHGTGLWGLT